MKQLLKSLVVRILSRQVRRLYKKHSFKTIAVVGSMGKTSTKLAIAAMLGKSMRVRYQDGDYGDIVNVPLVYFGQELPALTNPIAWIKIFLGNAKQIKGNYPYDVVVLELNTDRPGGLALFKSYVKADLTVLTATAPERMEFFADLDAVAAEETSVKEYTASLIYNADLVEGKYRTLLPEGSVSYGIKQPADFHLTNVYHSASGLEGDIKHGEEIYLHVAHEVVSETQLYSMLAGVAVGQALGLKRPDLTAGIANIHPISGRLRRLRGVNNSTIIDDTYSSSPGAVKAALETLYKADTPQKIAILGNMNQLGKYSVDAHKEVGEFCDPERLAMVVTIGPDANAHLAAAAEAKGCQVRKFDNPYRAGEFLQTFIQANALILAKGSQDGIFAEEAVKLILADPEDAAKLVRQSPQWLRIKQAQFKDK